MGDFIVGTGRTDAGGVEGQDFDKAWICGAKEKEESNNFDIWDWATS